MPTDQIKSVADCLARLRRLVSHHEKAKDQDATILGHCGGATFPYGIWFRGESIGPDYHPLTPSVFRPKSAMQANSTKNEKSYYDESRMYSFSAARHQQLAAASSLFESLSVMQHHDFPTRLLDWSESVATALFFAVKGGLDRGGRLYMINARKLNALTGLRKSVDNIHEPDSFGTRFRCAMVTSNTKEDWFRSANIITSKGAFDWFDKALSIKYNARHLKGAVPAAALMDHCTPVAVLPTLSNGRIARQLGMFTLHGGKKYGHDALVKVIEGERIPPPVGLIELNNRVAESKRFLMSWFVPEKAKPRIVSELRCLGVTEATMYPEIDHAAKVARELF